jgi:proteasome lid subunit RPN8/RPN11
VLLVAADWYALAATYGGAWPSGTIGIVHTHPHERFMPSHNDMNVSRRVHLPVIVITHERIEFVSPDGTTGGWTLARVERQRDDSSCRPVELEMSSRH